MKYICREYDRFDNCTFGYIAFTDKASAKSYRRRWQSPGNVEIAVYESEVSCPTGKYFDSGMFFIRLERDSFEAR